MSKLSPFRKHTASYIQQYSPVNPYYNENKTNDKQKPRRQTPIEHTNKRYYNDNTQQYLKLTQKKRYEQTSNINIDHLLEKNQSLASENAELYMMLEERGKIIVALEKKLEEQVRAEMKTLEAIDLEKGKFMAESHKKFKEYERKIEELINQIYLLNEQKQHGNYINAQQMNSLKETFSKEQLFHFQSIAQNQASARQISEFEKLKMKTMLENKNNLIDQMNMEFQAANEKLKNEIITLNNEIVHLNHMRKIELSEQKIMFEGMLENKTKDHMKEKELLIMQYSLQVKKLQNHLAGMESKANQIGEEKKIVQIYQNTRELQLIQNNNKLQNEIHEVEEFHRRTNFQETQRLKEMNKNEVKVLEASNDAIITNLKTENTKLINIVNTKSQQIDRLLGEVNSLRNQQALDSENYEKMIEELKQKMRQMEKDFIQEEERLKIKFAQLRDADIRALKDFYQHQIEVLNQDLYEKSNLANKNRALLHEQLHSKNQMRKNFDIQILRLNSRIAQLELRLDQSLSQKKEELKKVSDKIQMTSDMLLRQTKDKEKVNQMNEQQKKKLYQLINTKDKQIEELNAKIALISKNNLLQVSHKNEEIELLKKAKEDIEIELKKEKYFYDNELKKKDILLKNNADIYRNDVQSLKAHHRSQMELITKQSTLKINNLEIELNKYRAVQKNLKIEVNNLNQTKEVQLKTKSNELSLEKERLQSDRKDSLEKLERYYQVEMGKLTTEISELKRQLLYKEQDLRGMAQKYHRLEQKLQVVMESQQKLKLMESKIVALGQDNNLVKNFAEIIKTRSK